MQMKHLLATVTLCLAAGSLPAHAAYSGNYERCLEAAQGITAKEAVCVTSESVHQDAMLNHYYNKLSKGLTPEQAKLLKDAQRAWIIYRDASLPFADSLGGANAINSTRILMEMTKDRAEELEQMCKDYLK